jgi:type IV pilus assembly protein PilM
LGEGVLQLTRKKKTGEIVGLDIEAGSIAAAEVRSNGAVQLSAAAIEPLPAGAFHDGEVTDADILSEALKSFFSKHKLSKQVRLGIGNQRVVVRTLRLPAIEDHKEMKAAVRFQAQEQIPMPLDQAVLEHQVVGGVPAEEGATPQVDVTVVAARRDMVSSFLEPIRRAGLEPVGVDLSAFGMIRALAGLDSGQAPDEAVLYCNVGAVMNLAVARGRACLFTRVSNAGLEGIAGRLGAETGLNSDDATQWLAHVGLERSAEEIEGDPEIVGASRRVLEAGVDGLVDELRLSLDYYGAQESPVPVARVVLCGQGSAIAGLASRMADHLGLPIGASRPAALSGQAESAAARLTLPFGLALES